MKWLWKLAEAVPLAGRGYLVVRYRATNVSARGDYALAVLGNLGDGGMNYTAAVMPAEWECDGRWHTASVGIRQVMEKFAAVEALAVQVIADAELPARLEIESLTLASRPVASPLSDWVDAQAAKAQPGFAPVDLPTERNLALADMLAALQMTGTFGGKEIAIGGVPFRLTPAPELLSTSLNGTGELRVPLRGKASEVYLLALTLFCGQEEPSRGSGKLTAIRDVDRFRLAVTYADGLTDEFLPLDVLTGRHEVRRGPAVLCVPVDPKRPLRELKLTDVTDRGAFAVAAVTVRTGKPAHPKWGAVSIPWDRLPNPPRDAVRVARQATPATESARKEPRPPALAGNEAVFSSDESAFALRLAPAPAVVQITHRPTKGTYLRARAPARLFAATVDGRAVESMSPIGLPVVSDKPATAMEKDYGLGQVRNDGPIVSDRPATATNERYGLGQVRNGRLGVAGRSVSATYRLGDTGLELALCCDSTAGGELRLTTTVRNTSSQARALELLGPQLAGFILGDNLADNWYFAQSGSLRFGNQQTVIRARHSGWGSPVQFVATFNPKSGDGLYLRTEDTKGDCRDYVVEKGADGMRIGVEYPVRTVAPGETAEFAPAVIGVCGGDWRPAFHAYRDWLETWYRPAAPRKQWFREVFNFRQRFLYAWGPLFDHAAGKLNVPSAREEGERNFGGVDYVHLFDWGSVPQHGRVYGRVGDYSPFDLMPWKKEDLRRQIAELQKVGVPVGLYIEGYLLQEKGKLGSGRGKAWQIKGAKGEPLYWPDSSEMFVCSAVKDWQEVQAQTYANMVRELDVSGMYLDQFGFAAGKDCHDPDHGHPVPGYCVLGERDCTKRVREAMDAAMNTAKPGVALYTEETPPDVTSQYQDGSFTYVMRHSLLQNARVPLNLFRFAVPSFKSFQILICDKPTGTWATGVKWTFFNGDGIWLEGVADDWFAPQTREAIRKCHALLREHRDAFTSDNPDPLVPTEQPGVYANLFRATGKQVYTLYNSRPQTVRGNLLRVSRRPGARYLDAWNGKPLTPVADGGNDLLRLELGPMDVGCVVCSWAR
jgi:hypothetical protein